MLTTSLQRLFNCGSWIHSTDHFQNLMTYFGKSYQTIDETPLPFSEILRLTNIEFAIDCSYSREDVHKIWREFSLWSCDQVYCYITLNSCKQSVATAINYQNDCATLEELRKFYDLAFTEHLHHHDTFLSLSYLSNDMGVHVANPVIHQSIESCFNTYVLAMDILGQSFEISEKKQVNKFLELVS